MTKTFALFTAMTVNQCFLQPNRVDIWQFCLNDEPKIAFTLLNDEEQQRAARFHFARHRRCFTVARALTRVILARYLAVDPRLLVFNYNPQGKPRLIDYPELTFNLSHSKDNALLAIGRTCDLGIDLEFFSNRPYQAIANQLFSPQELQDFNLLADQDKRSVFFHIWVQKEAFVKASGLGFAYPMQQLTVNVQPPSDSVITDVIFNQHRHVFTFKPWDNCWAAVCCEPSIDCFRKIDLKNTSDVLASIH